MDTAGLAALIGALNEPCCCESSGTCTDHNCIEGREHQGCKRPMNRWWNAYGPDILDEIGTPEARTHRRRVAA
jgi:hypothetical protein